MTMELPQNVRQCMHLLEAAGADCYAVGGCVRDAQLGIAPHDYDLCTSFPPARTKAVFREFPLVLAGEKHGTVGVITPDGVVEITTFRREGSYRDSRHPDWVSFVNTIEEDLARRDFTVNAMAYSPKRGVVDPFGGQEDLKNRILRAVGDPEQRFREDALRILRGVRFAARYGLTPEEKTFEAMVAQSPLMSNLARERVFEELCGILCRSTAADLIRCAPILTHVIPQLRSAVGFDQRSPHHAYDVYTHIAGVVEKVPAQPELRWAALLHDVGKVNCFTLDSQGRGHFYGHAGESARLARELLLEMKAPTALRERVVLLISLHMTKIEPERKTVRRWLCRLGSETLEQLLLLQEADMGSKGTGEDSDPQFAAIRKVIAEIMAENDCLSLKDLAVNGHDLMALGISGKAIGEMLNTLLGLVLDEQVENSKEALLAAARNSK